jgi:hypothetical protein
MGESDDRPCTGDWHLLLVMLALSSEHNLALSCLIRNLNSGCSAAVECVMMSDEMMSYRCTGISESSWENLGLERGVQKFTAGTTVPLAGS